MTDFIKQHPSVSVESYMWEWTIPQIKLSCFDNTHIVYLPDKSLNKNKQKRPIKRIDTAEDLLNDLGIPIFDKQK